MRSLASQRLPLAAYGGAALAAALALVLALGAVDTPDPANALNQAADSLGAWTYVFVPTLAFLETGAFIGLLVPGETAIVVGGVVAERDEVALPVLIGLVWIAAVGGDVASFLLGRRRSWTRTEHGSGSAPSTWTGSSTCSTATAARPSWSAASSGSSGR
jgi:hypothetical protein